MGWKERCLVCISIFFIYLLLGTVPANGLLTLVNLLRLPRLAGLIYSFDIYWMCTCTHADGMFTQNQRNMAPPPDGFPVPKQEIYIWKMDGE